MKKPPTLPALKKKAWKLYSQWIRQSRSSWPGFLECYTCGKTFHWKGLQAGHFLAKNLGSNLYFHPDNIRVQCIWCNKHLHGNQAEFMKRLLKEIGRTRVTKLFELKKETHQFTRKELLGIIETTKVKLEKLK